jgi:dephospho-CoA kinase
MTRHMGDRKFLLAGLTGGIATGKSTVSEMFRRLGAVIIDADLLAREVVEPGEPALAQIAAEFGKDVIQADGTLDRKKLGALVFGNAERRKRLEQLTHPAIRDRFRRRLAELEAQGFDGIVLWDAPVMIESGGYRDMDRLVVVATDEATQSARLCARDSIDAAEANQKIRSQMPVAEKAKLADYVIDNVGDRAATEARVREVLSALATELEVARRLAGRPMPLAALFPVNMGHYGSNRMKIDTTFRTLKRQLPDLNFVAYHPNPSGNFVFEEPRVDGIGRACGVSERLLGLECIARRFSDLIRLYRAIPAGTDVNARSVVLRQDDKALKVIAVFLSNDVPASASVIGTLGARITALRWVSARDVICLYDRPPKSGSVGHVREALIRRLRQLNVDADVSGTARAVSVIRDIVTGRLRTVVEGAVHAEEV